MNRNFSEKVFAAVRAIPAGRVSTYGQIAEMIGCPGAARAVGNTLHKNPDPDGTPCFRVVNAKGRLAPGFAFGGPKAQAKRLRADGIEVHNNHVDIQKYGWKL